MYKDEENENDDENKKEPLNFLNASEQKKVRKMISVYQKLEDAEIGI